MAKSKSVRPKVSQMLEANTLLRDSDKRLLIAFWASEGLELTEFQKTMFMQCTPAESITRARRFLRDKFPGSPKVEQARFERMEEEQQDHSNFFTKRFGRLAK